MTEALPTAVNAVDPAWPWQDSDAPQPARIGCQLAARKKTPLQVVMFWAFLERGKDLPQAPDDQKQDVPLRLCGTDTPGDVHFECLAPSGPDSHDYPEARMAWYELALAWVVAPFVGSPESDPRVLEEGTERPGWWLDPQHGPLATWEAELLLGDGPVLPSRVPGETLGAAEESEGIRMTPGTFTVPHEMVCAADPVTGRAVCICEDEEPEDYDGYVDYLTGQEHGDG